MSSVAVSRRKPARRSLAARVAPAIGVAILLGAAFLFTQIGARQTGNPAPGATSTAAASAPPAASDGPGRAAPPADRPPEEHIEKTNGSREIMAIGAGPTDDAALADARSRALALFEGAVRAALPESIRAANGSGVPPPASVIAARLLQQMGPSAAPERIDTRSLAAPRDRSLAVRFRVSDAVFDQAVVRFGSTQIFRGARVVPALPSVADAGWIVVTASSFTEVHPGDRIVAVGPVTLAPPDLPSTVVAPAPEVRIARGDSIVLVRWVP